MPVRNLKNEALNLVKGLSRYEKYKLYELALSEKSKARNPERQNEMSAVLHVLEEDKTLEISTLLKMNSTKSELSNSVARGDLIHNARKNKRKQ